MKKYSKKAVTLILTALMLQSTLAMTTSAYQNETQESQAVVQSVDSGEGENVYNGYVYIVEDTDVAITGYEGTETAITIPSTINGKAVAKIESYAFQNSTVTSVVIPNSVKFIGYEAFDSCANLTTVTIGSGVTEMQGYTFENCTALSKVVFKSGIKAVGICAFNNCTNLTTVTLPSTVTDIGNGAFKGCKRLRNITLPANLQKIGNDAFINCTNLPAITFGEQVKMIGSYAFKNCSHLTELTIPDSVQEIGYEAFYNCSKVETLSIGGGVTNMGGHAFENCLSLNTLTIKSGTTFIGGDAFKGCSNLTSVAIPSTVTTLAEGAFYECKQLAEVTIANGVKYIGTGVFSKCEALATLTIGNTVESIGGYAFNGCTSLTKVTVPDSVKTLGADAFSECTALQTAKIGKSVNSMGSFVFSGCTALKTVTITSGTTVLGAATFFNCPALTKVSVPNTVTTIGNVKSGDTELKDGEVFYKHGTGLKIYGKDKSFAQQFAEANGLTFVIETVNPTAIKLSKTSATISAGSAVTLKATITPTDATDQTVTWTTSDSTIATVSSSGKVTGKKAGTATITAKTVNGKTAVCTVTVTGEAIINPTAISLNKTSTSINEGSSTTLTATITPDDATDKTVTWSTSNSAVATVSSSGKVTGKTAGTATITAKTVNGKTATCKVTVKEVILPTAISLNKTSASVYEGSSITLTATIIPDTATNKTVTWTTSDSTIATVSTTGKVTGKAVGTATITAKTSNGKTATCKVTVKEVILPTEISLNKTSASIYEGESITLKATITPTDATDKTVTWITSNPAVATVSTAGKITGIAVGTTTIKVKTTNGKTASCKVTVKEVIPPTAISLNRTSADINIGSSLTLTPTITPTDATYKTVTWTTSDSTVATVSSDGKVTGKGLGTATIKAKTVNGKTASCKIIVSPKAKLNKTGAVLGVQQPCRLQVTDAAAGTTFTWSSSDRTVATVNKNGKVIAKAKGTAVITVKTSEGKTASCNITVKAAPTKIVLDKTALTMSVGETATLTKTVSPETALSAYKWVSSDTSVVTVDSSGKLTAKEEGLAVIMVSSSNGKTALCVVTVE